MPEGVVFCEPSGPERVSVKVILAPKPMSTRIWILHMLLVARCDDRDQACAASPSVSQEFHGVATFDPRPNHLQVLAIASSAQCEDVLVDLQISICPGYEVNRACRDLTTGIRPIN